MGIAWYGLLWFTIIKLYNIHLTILGLGDIDHVPEWPWAAEYVLDIHFVSDIIFHFI